MTFLPLRLNQAARLRSAAISELWQHRNSWLLPVPRALMRRERDALLPELMPALAVIALMVGFLLFVTLPSAIGDAYITALETLWPAWVQQVAPIAAAQLLAMQRLPTVALELSNRHARGEFEVLARLQSSPAVYPCVPLLVAHAVVTMAATFLLTGLSLLAGILAALVTATGDLRQMLDVVFSLVSPQGWLLSLVTALVLGLVCSLACTLYAWPGTRSTRAAVDAHRLGLRTMIVSSFATVLAALVLNWLMSLAVLLIGW